MSKNILLIDNIAFSKKNERIEGELSLPDFPRLEELMHSSNLTNPTKINYTGLISYVLQGKTDAVGQHILQLTVACSLTTACQRCLNAMPLNLSLNFNYLIGEVSDTDVEAVDIDNSDDYDLQQANKAMDLIALIEDEIIMAMPIAPMHEEGCTELTTQSGEKPNPFAVLKGLIKP
ncbi:MAG: YceD family protein [Methylotenera sp.]|uniref:YceD family protein n=1 Tax=Methylotenera sp. TaxID=2051956 RepID=UPI00248875BF|nr:YceD family protein [Methylotenera sp.]MDI1309370.1 YceD family protein [Methylotenera sp.]